MSAKVGRFAVVIDRERSDGLRETTFYRDEDDNGLRFATREAAREAVRGAMWEWAWVWWIVELEEDGRTTLGTVAP